METVFARGEADLVATVVAEGGDDFACGEGTVVELKTNVEVLMADDVDVVVAGRYFGSAYADEPGITDAVVEGRNGDGRGIADGADCLVGTEVEDYLYG